MTTHGPPPARVFFYVQHLQGLGHLKRAAILARALAADGFDVHLVSGGMPIPGLDTGQATLHQLPALRVGWEGYRTLFDETGNAVDEAWKAARRDHLLALFERLAPDVLITEAFPFGRPQMHFELLPLLDKADQQAPRPLILSSVRDVLHGNWKPDFIDQITTLASTRFDHVLVHGDPDFMPLEESFPPAAQVREKLIYTGLVVQPPETADASPPPSARHGVIVSTGGAAPRDTVLRTAAAARPLSRYRSAPWRLLAGPNIAEADVSAIAAELPDGMTIERHRPDFPELLRQAAVSVSQGGYNTVMDVLQAGTPAVVVPFADGKETEQSVRAAKLAERGLIEVIDEGALSPQALARQIDSAGTRPVTSSPLNMAGASALAGILRKLLSDGTPGD